MFQTDTCKLMYIFSAGFCMIYILRRHEKEIIWRRRESYVWTKKKIHAALKFQAGVNFISDTCKHPLTRWNIHSVLQDSMFAYLVWLWFIWWSRLTNEPRKPWRTLKTPGKNYPLKKFMETQGHFFGFWRNIENSILKRKKLIKNKIKFRFCRSCNCLLQRQVFYKAGKSVKKMSFSLDIVKKFENPVRNGQGFIIFGTSFCICCLSKIRKDFGTLSLIYHPFLMVKVCLWNTGIGKRFLSILPEVCHWVFEPWQAYHCSVIIKHSGRCV